jgi:thioredoxin-like negative regulator of GroEL
VKKLAVGLIVVLAGLGGFYVYLVAYDVKPPMTAYNYSTYKEAVTEYSRGNLTRACELLKLYCDSHATDVDARLLYAKMCIESGRVKEAAAVLGEIPAENVARTVLLATIARQTGEYHECQRLLKTAIKTNPNDARLWRELGILFNQIGDPRSALSAIQRSLKLDPKQEDLAQLSAQLSSQAAMADIPRSEIPSPRGRGPGLPIGAANPMNPHDLVPRPGTEIPDPFKGRR